MVNKICSICFSDKDELNFRRNGIQSNQCRDCYKKVVRKKLSKDMSSWFLYLIEQAKRRAKHRNKQFTITINDLLELFTAQNGKCFWYGIDLLLSENNKDPQAPSIDRIDNEKGYTKDNVVLSCFAANMGRNSTDNKRFSEFASVLTLLAKSPSHKGEE